MKSAPNASKKKKRTRRIPALRPTLRFTPTAWAKLIYLRDYGDTEIGGFGISSADDLLLIEDVQLVNQQCTAVTVAFDDEAVADYFDKQVDVGLQLGRFARIWIHTHPGESAEPSVTDEETFARCFGNSDWSIMCIVAAGGETYTRLQFNVGPAASVTIPIEINFHAPFSGSNPAAWEQEYLTCVRSIDLDWWKPVNTPIVSRQYLAADDDDWFNSFEATLVEEDCFD
ncbi:MAG TPA: hypothetical protein QF564_27985 [Pirellulaceae bacterium]|nr:hypothetical protein [Pirellulaceae bacterium]